MTDKVRLGIIGIGNQGSTYARHIALENWCPEIELTAITDLNPDRIAWAKENVSDKIAYFTDAIEMLDSGLINACVVSVPHYDHPKYVIECMKRGIHVMCEKPAGVYTKQVREMNAEAEKHPEVVFGMMFNQRTNCLYRKMRELVQSGKYGRVRRANWLITNWYRSQYYYDSGDWRATWSGEGGGVLLNQCPHQLDLWQWICGMPSRIRAFMKYGVGRDIEVENDVTAYAEYPNGATGLFITSTHETPGTNRLEISGDKGKIVVENDEITFWRNRVGEKEFNETYTGGFGNPECWKISVPVTGPNPQHIGILNNFCSAVLHGTPLLAPGQEGIRGLSISNAMHLSYWTDSWVDPSNLDEDLYYDLLQEKIRQSDFVKKTSAVTLNTEGSY